VNTNCLRRFLFENSRIRGVLVSIDETFRTAIERHAYPEPVRNLVGEALSATALLAATIKFDGSLALRVQSDGPVNLLVTQISGDRFASRPRALARRRRAGSAADAHR